MLPSTFMVPFSSIRVKKNEQNLIGAAPSIVPLATYWTMRKTAFLYVDPLILHDFKKPKKKTNKTQ